MNFNHLIGTVILLFIVLPSNVFAQKERSMIWYFGEYAGVDFNTEPPTALINSAMSTDAGTSVICDTDGNLLFYTNGETIWNKQHNEMQNGTGLYGDKYWAQTLIMPHLGNDKLYYVFTINEEGLYYSVVNMDLANGLGAVISEQKNLLLHTNVASGLTAVIDTANSRIWLIIFACETSSFIAYKICPDTIFTEIIASNTNGLGVNYNDYTKIRASNNGNYIVFTIENYDSVGENLIAMYNFDCSSGLLDFFFKDEEYETNYYDIIDWSEFSPDNKKLYVSASKSGIIDTTYIFQYNLLLPASEIKKSKFCIVKKGSPESKHFSGLQLAPNNKIYISILDFDTLAVINNPDELGTACDFSFNGIDLQGRKAIWGLPNMIPGFLYTSLFDYTQTCFSDPTLFTISSNDTILSALWNFGDSTTSTGTNPSHTYEAPGSYTVTLTVTYTDKSTETLSKEITIYPKPEKPVIRY